MMKQAVIGDSRIVAELAVLLWPDNEINDLEKELLTQCEYWAKSHGCCEFASDCELNNIGSLKFHLQLGFEEANRIICFKKKL